MFGQIATFCDNLCLSYHEVVYEIPYRNLILMQKDKLRTVYGGEKVSNTSGKDMLKRKK
nr:MAG TPA: hypothetical protein [Caudoviricetes sp.]